MAVIRSFIKIAPTSTKSEIGLNFNQLRKAINRQGMVVNDIGKNLVESSTLLEFQQDYLKNQSVVIIREEEEKVVKEKTFMQKMRDKFRRKTKKKQRDAAEDAAEEGLKEAEKKDNNKLVEGIKKPIKGFLATVLSTLGTIIEYFVVFGALDWISKNPEKVEKLIRLVFAIGKFAATIVGFGVNLILDGLTNTFGNYEEEGPLRRGLRGVLGVIQLFSGLAALRGAQYLLMPWKILQDGNRIKDALQQQNLTKQEMEKANQARIKGYKDKKTGAVYSKEEYDRMRKAAQRKDKKGGKGSNVKAFEERFGRQYKTRQKGPVSKMKQRGRIGLKKLGKGFKKVATPGRVAGGLSVLGGGLRIASGIAAGESAGTAVGAGVGQAVGGIAGAAALTAVAPFLGPFAPMIGSAIGGFLGEFIGKQIGPIIEPIFGPIGRFFQMSFDVFKDVFAEIAGPFQELFEAAFSLASKVGSFFMDSAKVLLDFGKFVFGPIFNKIGAVIGFIIDKAKVLMDPLGAAAKATGDLFGGAAKATGNALAGTVDFLTFGITDLDGKSRPAGGGNGASGGSPTMSGNFDEKFAAVLGDYEGLRLKAYPDANYGWEIPTIGIGATYYPAGFRLSGKVKKGDTITKEEAYWIKSKHIEEHRKRLVNEIGAELYGKTTERQKVGLESVVFNYGSLSGAGIKETVKNAIQSGNFAPVISAYRNKLAKHNGGVNSWRRNDEADIMEKGSGTRVPGIQFASAGGKIIQDVPYINQRANKADKYGRPGDTQCYSTTMAMWASQLTGKPMTAEDYNQVRSKYGISTQAYPQKKALADFGINSSLQTGMGWNALRDEIKAGYPVPVGFKYKGSGHWGMVVGMKDDGFVVHDPFGQLGMGGTWKKTNSAGNKTDGPGKYYFMDKNLFQNQLPDGDVYMWKAPRSIKPSKKLGDVTTQGEGSSPQPGSTAGPGSEAGLRDSATGELFKTDTIEGALAAMTQLLTTGIGKLSEGMANEIPSESPQPATTPKVSEMSVVDTKLKQMENIQKTVQKKAEKDADQEMQAAPPVIINNNVTKQVINKSGGKAVPIYSTPSPMLTN